MTTPRWGIARRLFAIDVLTMVFVAALAAGIAARAGQIPGWLAALLACIAVVAGVPILGGLRAHLDLGAVRFLHDWSFAFCVSPIGWAVVQVAGPGHAGNVYDAWLIAADRWAFGTDPTVRLALIAHPIVTEILQAAYSLFYALPIVVAAELYLGGREDRFRRWVFVCGCGFFLVFGGYLVVPAVGPRYTLHAGGAAAGELPGLWLTPLLRSLTDGGVAGPSVAAGGDALRLAPRDAFPSGRALVALLAVAWAWRRPSTDGSRGNSGRSTPGGGHSSPRPAPAIPQPPWLCSTATSVCDADDFNPTLSVAVTVIV
jgi:hypothetical protein